MIDTNEFELKASRVHGSQRQLFSNLDGMAFVDQGELNRDAEFVLRPQASRSRMGISSKIGGDMRITSSFHGNCSILQVDSNECDIDHFKSHTGIGGSNPCKPALIRGCTLTSRRPAGSHNWCLAELVELLGPDRRLEVAQSNATVRLCDYIRYLESSQVSSDDEPVYIFETLVDGEHDDIIMAFSVPPFFTDLAPNNLFIAGCHRLGDTADLFSVAGPDGLSFGLHRWLIMGPRGSGSNVHVDPLGTSAWNTLLLGSKLWVMFPPETNEADIKSHLQPGVESGLPSEDFCAGAWFANTYPNIEDAVLRTRLEIIQKEGETIYVPAGWFHAVLNLELTVCVTQNFAAPCHYRQIALALYAVHSQPPSLNAPASSSSHGASTCSSEDEEAWAMADEWRVSVTKGWPDLHDEILSTCVHCGPTTAGNSCELLSNRPVCTSCQSHHETQYEMINESQVESIYGVQMWKIPRGESPPFVMRRWKGKLCKYYLHSHIRNIEVFDVPIKHCGPYKVRQKLLASRAL